MLKGRIAREEPEEEKQTAFKGSEQNGEGCHELMDSVSSEQCSTRKEGWQHNENEKKPGIHEPKEDGLRPEKKGRKEPNENQAPEEDMRGNAPAEAEISDDAGERGKKSNKGTEWQKKGIKETNGQDEEEKRRAVLLTDD